MVPRLLSWLRAQLIGPGLLDAVQRNGAAAEDLGRTLRDMREN